MRQWIFLGAVVLAILWTVGMVAWRNAAGGEEEKLIDEIALSHSRAVFSHLVDMRSWAADHGGVYVPVTEKTQPNPYLNHPQREITATDGKVFTLINPAYMTRQIAEIGNVRHGMKIHITARDPMRPGNAPEDWEGMALDRFAAGDREYHGLVEDQTGGYMFRYMAPLTMEPSCATCHTSGKAVGDVVGGISISIPVDELVAGRQHVLRLKRIAFASAWLAGMLAIAGVILLVEKTGGGRSGQLR